MVRRSYLFSSVLAVRLDSAESHYLFALPAEKCSDVYPNKSSPLEILYGICPNKSSPAFALTNPLRHLSLGTPNIFCCSSQLWLPAEHTTDLKAVSTEYSFPRSLNSALTVLPLPVMSVVMFVATPSLWCLLLPPLCGVLLLLPPCGVCCYPLPVVSVATPSLWCLVATPSLWCLLLPPPCGVCCYPLSVVSCCYSLPVVSVAIPFLSVATPFLSVAIPFCLFLVCCYPLLSVAIPFLSVAIPPLYVAPLC